MKVTSTDGICTASLPLSQFSFSRNTPRLLPLEPLRFNTTPLAVLRRADLLVFRKV